MKPFYEDIQAHYDLSDDFFALFLDPTRTYSCAYFERPDMTLEEAQRAKLELSLGKCDLPPRGAAGRPLRLLDIGCGWGGALRHAVTTRHVEGIGLTLSRNQHAFASTVLKDAPVEIRLQGWEEFDEPVDRIVSIGAFEHFRAERYGAFFALCHRVLPAGGRMLLHTIVREEVHTLRKRGIHLGPEDIQFMRFILEHIFPGSQLHPPERVVRRAEAAGFQVLRTHSLQPHYARTLDIWSANLAAARDRAVQLTSQATYDIYQRYLMGCADYFRTGRMDVVQFTLQKA